MSTSPVADNQFDYYQQNTYKLGIIITDSDGMRTTELSNVTVHVTWVNRPPVFGPEGLLGYSSTIPEKSVSSRLLP